MESWVIIDLGNGLHPLSDQIQLLNQYWHILYEVGIHEIVLNKRFVDPSRQCPKIEETLNKLSTWALC